MIPIENVQASTVWKSFLHGWVDCYGKPNKIVFDSHGEFRGEFVDGCERHGIVTYRISREGPWQAGHTERHGGV